MQRFCPYLQYKQDESVILCAHIYNPLPQWCPPHHPSNPWRPWRTVPFLLTLWNGTRCVLCCSRTCFFLLLLLLFVFTVLPLCPRSQSRDFDDVVSSWARCGLDGLDARGRRVTRWRPPVRGPVESVPVWAQSGRRREADDRRGDPAAFAVDPASVAGFLVEGRTTREETNRLTSYFSQNFPWAHQIQTMNDASPLPVVVWKRS